MLGKRVRVLDVALEVVEGGTAKDF